MKQRLQFCGFCVIDLAIVINVMLVFVCLSVYLCVRKPVSHYNDQCRTIVISCLGSQLSVHMSKWTP